MAPGKEVGDGGQGDTGGNVGEAGPLCSKGARVGRSTPQDSRVASSGLRPDMHAVKWHQEREQL